MIQPKTEHLINKSVDSCCCCYIISFLYLDRIYEIQIENHDLYLTKADDNRIRVRPIEPIRGSILDRNGTILAESFDTFDIVAKKKT